MSKYDYTIWVTPVVASGYLSHFGCVILNPFRLAQRLLLLAAGVIAVLAAIGLWADWSSGVALSAPDTTTAQSWIDWLGALGSTIWHYSIQGADQAGNWLNEALMS